MNEELDTSGAVAAYLKNGVQADPATGARASMSVAVGSNADYEAELRDVSRRTGVPVDSVRAFPDETKRQAQVGAIDFGGLAQQFPKTAAFLSGVDNARVAHDDVDNLTATERAFQGALASGRAAQGRVDGPAYIRSSGTIEAVERSWWQGITEPVQRGLAQGRRGLTLLFNELGVFNGLQRQRDAARAAAGLPPEGNAELAVRLANQQREIERYPVPDDIARGMQEISGASTMGYALEAALSNPPAVFETTLQSLGASAPALVGAAAGSVAGPVGTATGAGMGSFAVEYGSTLQDVMAEKGVNASDPMAISAALNNPELMAAARDKAIKRGIPIAIFDALTAGLAGRLLAGAKPTAVSVAGRAAGELGLQAGGGAAGEATAQAATGEYKPGDILMEALAELPTAVVEVPGNYRSALARAQAAEQGARTVEQINELAKASKLAQRDPATFEAFVAQAAEGGPVQDVFINAQTLAQSGVAEQLAQVSPAVAEQLPAALATGGDIKIPVAEYAARIAPTEYAQGLLDHLKTEPQGMSRAEAQEFMQSQAEVLKAEVEQVLAEKQGDDTFKTQVEAVKAEVKTQLDETARFTGQVNDAYASMVSNFYAVMAAKLGISPQDLFSRYPLKIAAERIAGDQVLEQFAGPQAQTADIYAMATAKDRIEKGQSAERVRRETGWFQGVDGKWRFEIADDEAKFYSRLGTELATREAIERELGNQIQIGPDPQVAGLFKAKVGEGTPNYLAAFGRSEEDARANLLKAIARKRSEGVFSIGEAKAGDVRPLGQVLDHPKLFAAYPDLAGLPVHFVEGTDFRGAYYSQEDRFDIALSADPDQMLSTLLHEVQHAIQQREGFARGGNADSDFAKAVKDAVSRMEAQARQAVESWKWANSDKLNAAEKAGREARFALMWESSQRLISYANRDKPSGVRRLILNELQWIYDADFREDNAAQELQRKLYGIPKPHKMAERNRYLSDLAFEAGQVIRAHIPEELRAQFKADERPVNLLVAALRRASDRKQKALAPLNELQKKARIARDVKESHEYSTPYDVYRALAGEVEARNTQARQKLTEAERLDTSPASTADVPYGSTIVMFGGMQVHAPVSAFGQQVYNQNKAGARGAFNPATNTITLLKNADLSTFLHESGHFFLETQFDIAAKLSQEAAMFGADTNKPGEQQVLKDTNALLQWFGVADLAEWYNLDFEQKRSYHEQFARGFEAYLFEGKAPSIELQGLFQRFRAWLLNVYRELKNLNVELTDEVRSVFDRMLATTDEIKLAEQGRSMMPLFTAPEQAGMTPDEFAAYQALGVDATNDAIQDVQARTLRDLAWTRNARGREIKRLQKEAAARRSEVQMEVRREVMSQPVYRAWQFLTGKLTGDDKAAVAPFERPKSKPGPVDESVDSLAVAIAKLGGMDRAEAESQWGVDPKERSPQPIFGKYLLRREGGLSLDGMGEALSQYGYLTLDEDGRYDLRELEEKFLDELRGSPHYSNAVDPAMFAPEPRPGEGVTTENVGAGRLDLVALKSLGIPDEIVEHIQNLKMTARDGIHPDLVAEMFGFTSGDELVRTLAAAQEPKTEIEGLTDARMLERYGELATPAAIEREADKAIHNEARARFVATEANALAKATGKPKVLASAAREFARAMIARLKIRDIRPGQYASAEVRAAKAAEKASKAGDLATAAVEKRNQLVNNYATRAAYDAQEEVEKGLRYLKKFDTDIKGLDADYADQIDALLERFDLRKQSLKAIDKRKALAEWIATMREQGLEPEIPPALENEAFRKSYRDLTVEELRGLVDTVRQIEHLGRLKDRLLTAADNRAFNAVKAEIVQSIEANARDRQADTRTPITNLGRALQQVKRFYAAHIKAASWARILDGGKDGGPMWEYFIRSANERGDMETTMRAEATVRLSELLAPVFKLGKMGGKGQFFATINRSLNREARIAIALNTGNQGNLQRLLGGEGWTVAQIAPVLQSLTAAEWRAVQAVWDYFESYRPQIEAKERRVYGRSPTWVEPAPFNIKTADGEELALRGGYYPIKYDPAASQRAEEHADAEGAKRQLQGAYTTATTRRSFTKTRVEEVSGRPLLYTLAGLYSGVNDVIHDLAWHEWLIDANRLLRSKSIDASIRNHYGPEVKAQFKSWAADIAEGDKAADNAGEVALSRLRQGISAAGLGFNAMSAALQVLGFTQSIVRVGPTWVGKGIARFAGSPLAATREVHGKSEFMANRARTRFRELNELRNKVQDESDTMRHIKAGTYFLMMRAQQMVDVPTWIGAYEKALAAGNEEERAISLADQAVIDAQGGGQTKDLAAIERGGPALRLFTVFYSFMNTAFNLGVTQTMTAKSKARLAADYLLIFVVPAVLGSMLKEALTPGGDDDEDMEALAKKLAAEQLSYLMGMMVVVREFSFAAKTIVGAEGASRDYTGPAGLRLVSDAGALVKQASQGEFDDAFRKAAINVIGDLTGLPSAQINRTITGAQALAEGETENPAAVVFGFQRQR